jgi:hypothetical protein
MNIQSKTLLNESGKAAKKIGLHQIHLKVLQWSEKFWKIPLLTEGVYKIKLYNNRKFTQEELEQAREAWIRG